MVLTLGVTLFFLTWAHRRDRFDIKTAVIYGILAGLMALVRPQDGIFLLLPFISQLPAVWQSLKKSDKIWLKWLRNSFIAGITALSVFSVQFIVWHQLYGGLFQTGYTDEPFFWLAPKLDLVLFSSQRGLFIWHPVFLLSILGLLFYWKRDKQIAIIGLLAFTIQWYLISSWHSWYQGDAFGGRMLHRLHTHFCFGISPFY